MIETKISAKLQFGPKWTQYKNSHTAGSAYADNKLLSGTLLSVCFESAGSAVSQLTLYLNGFYAAVSVTDSYIFAAVDRIRSIPIFYLLQGDRVLLSDDPYWIREQAGASEPDKSAEDELLLTRYITGPDTLCARIKQLQAGEYLLIDRNVALDKQAVTKRYYTFRHSDAFGEIREKAESAGARQELDSLVEKNIKALEQAFRRLAEYTSGRPVVVPLSGGYDSRLVVLMLKRIRYDPIYTFSFGREGNADSRVSRQVAENLNLPWVFIPYDPDSIYRMINSDEWRQYNRMADGLCSTCFDRDWPALWILKKDGLIPEDSVIVPGHSGDFISGGHIREGLAQKKKVRAEEFAGEILDRHYTMWKWKGREEELRPALTNRILSCTGVDPVMGREQACDAYERWVWQEFQSKYLVNGVRVYEFWGYDWWLPLWDAQYMDFWSKVPLRWRLGRRLYNETVFRLYSDMAGISREEAKIRENSTGRLRSLYAGAGKLAKDIIRNTPLKPAAAAVRDWLNVFRPSLPRSETMELDWEQCQGRLHRKLYEALKPYMTNRSSSVTLEKLGYIRFSDEELSPEVLQMLRQMRGAGLRA